MVLAEKIGLFLIVTLLSGALFVFTGSEGGASTLTSLQLVDGQKVNLVTEPRDVVVKFWASWCGACRLDEKVLETDVELLASKYLLYVNEEDQFPKLSEEGKLPSMKNHFFDKGGNLQKSFEVTLLPTYLVLRSGKEVARFNKASDLVGYLKK